MNASTPSEGLFSRLSIRRRPMSETIARLRTIRSSGHALRTFDVAAVLSRDPLASLDILKRANHEYYGYLGCVDSLSHGIELLTADSVASYLLELDPGEDEETPAVIRRLSEHAYHSGLFAHRVTTGAWLFDDDVRDLPGAVFTTGHLHSAGRLVLAASFPDQARSLYGDGDADGLFVRRDWTLAERLQFGADSVEVAEYVFGKFQLPDRTAAIIRFADRPQTGPVSPVVRKQAALIRLSAQLAAAAGYGLSTSVSYLEILQDEFWTPYIELGVIDEAGSESLREQFPARRRSKDFSGPVADRHPDRESAPHAGSSGSSPVPGESADRAGEPTS